MKLMRWYITGAALAALAVGMLQASDTGTITIATKEKSGGAFPGVVVQIKNSKGLAAPAAKQTDSKGEALFIVPIGAGYTVEVSVAGFATQTSEEFKVSLDKKQQLVFTMQEQLVETVKVRGDKVIDLDAGAEGKTTFSENFIEDLPILGRSYQNVLKLAPGVQDTNGDGNPNVHGSRERDFKATIDGVSNVDPLTGTFMSNVNPDAIEDIEIVTTGAGAEYGGAVGGFGKIITKQGTNAFDGNFSITLRSSLLDGGTVVGGDAEPIDYHDVRPALVFSGPIVKDKLFFLLSHEYQDRGRPVAFLGTGGIVVTTKGTRNSDKVTWQASPKNKLIFQMLSDPLRVEPLGVDALTDPRSGYSYKQGGPIYQFHWDTQISSVFNIQSLIGASHTGISAHPTTLGIKNNCGIDIDYQIGLRQDPFGGPVAQPIDEDQCFESKTSRTSGSFVETYSDDRIRYTAKSDASYYIDNFLGISHTLKGGIQAQKSRFEASDSYRGFSIFDEIRSAGLDQASFAHGGRLTRQVNYPPSPDAAHNNGTGSYYSLYLEDQFRPHPNVSLRVGIRAEQENLEAQGYEHFDPAAEYNQYLDAYNTCRAGGQNADRCARSSFHFFHTYDPFPAIGNSNIRNFVEDPTVGLQPRVVQDFRVSNTNIAPRFSVSWDPGTNGKMKLFGSAGRYFGETFLLIPLYEQPPDPFVFSYRVIADESTQQCRPDSNGDGTPECVIYPTIDSDANANIAPASVRQVDRNLKTPYQDEFTIGFSAEVFQETSITITAIRRKFRNQFQDVDLNHFARDLGNTATAGCVVGREGSLVPVDTKPDGIFDDCGGRIRPLAGGQPGQQLSRELPDGIPDIFAYNPFFNQINRVGNFNQSDYKAYQVEMTRRLHRNWQLEGSYVFSKATGAAEDYNQTLGNDPTTVQDEEGYLSFDQRHVVKVNVSTQVPLWNIRLSSAMSWQSGLPYSITRVAASVDGKQFYGNTAINYPSLRTSYPTAQRNDQRNSSFWQVDASAKKDFSLGKTTLTASLDVFNLLNNQVLVVTSVVNGRTNAFQLIGRQFQLGAKVSF